MASPILFGKYHLLEKISAGGMAEVFKAKSYGVAGFEKLLVIKKILPHLGSDQEFIQMFLDEARISVSLSHGNIVQVIDLGREGDTYFMAMEYVHGQDLARTLMRGSQLDPVSTELMLFIVCETLKALDYAHRRRDREQRELNIVHCDISPQNILLSYEGEVKLADFGISKAAFQAPATQAVVRGKYAYMSPEQVDGRPLDRRSDIFAMGILLWEMLTGKRLFKTENVDKTLQRVLSSPIAPPSSIQPGVDPELDRITLKALSRDRALRYQEDQDMLDELSAFMFSRSMLVGAADLSAYLRRIFARELQKAREEEQSAQPGRVVARGKTALFIPLGSGRSILAVRLEDETVVPALARIGVGVICAEWTCQEARNLSLAERSRLLLELSERLQRLVEGGGGELWEVNHNSLVACWRGGEDPQAAALRAVECALNLREELQAARPEEAARAALDIAVDFGPVIVDRRSGNPLAGWQITRTFALPRLINNQLAGKGLTLITRAVRDRVAERFEETPHALEGRLGAVLPTLFQVSRLPRTIDRVVVSCAPFTRYLGREKLLVELASTLERVIGGQGCAVMLEGEEGAGRSRLRDEFRQLVRSRGGALYLTAGAHEQRHFAYAVLLKILRRICGIAQPETAESENRKLARLNELGLSQDEIGLLHDMYAESKVEYVRNANPVRQRTLFALFDKIVSALSQDAPLVLVIEDFQNIDRPSEAYFDHLMASLPSRRVLLLLETPQGFVGPWPTTPALKRVRVEPLTSALVEEMIRDMTEVTGVAGELLSLVTKTSGGNPLFVKELVAWLVEGGHVTLQRRKPVLKLASGVPKLLPTRLTELFARRYQVATPELRLALKAGAVLGMQFPLEVLGRFLPEIDNIRETVQRGVTLGILKGRQGESSTWFRFRHSHCRRLALEDPSASLSTRQLYARLARQLEAWGDFARGGRIEYTAVSAFSAELPDAPRFMEEAGDKLLGELGFDSALKWYGRALEATRAGGGEGEDTRKRLRVKIANVTLQQGLQSDSESLLESGLTSARRLGAGLEAAELLLDLAHQHTTRGENDQAMQVLREAHTLVKDIDAQGPIAAIEREMGRVYLLLADPDQALYCLRAGYQRARIEDDKQEILAQALAIGAFYHQVGDDARALESLRRVLDAAVEQRELGRVQQVLMALGELLQDLGRDELALRCIRESLSMARVAGDDVGQAAALARIGELCLRGGSPQRAFSYLKTGLDLANALNRGDLVLRQRLTLALLRARMGDPRAALREIQAVMSRPQAMKHRREVVRAHLLTGECYALLQDRRRAREALERALRGAQELKHAPLTHLARGALEALAQQPPARRT